MIGGTQYLEYQEYQNGTLLLLAIIMSVEITAWFEVSPILVI